MRKLVHSIMILAGAIGTISAYADDIYLGNPSYGGNGCPAGSASATLSPDAKSLSILFDSYTAEAGYSNGKRLDRKSCNVAIPIHVPQGFSVSIFQIDYRGFNSVPAGGRSTFNVEYFFAGQRGPAYQRNFLGPLDDEFMIRNTLQATAIIWSACGQDVILRTNSSVTAQTNNRMDQVLSTVDSADISAGIVYQLQWRRCGSNPFAPAEPVNFERVGI